MARFSSFERLGDFRQRKYLCWRVSTTSTSLSTSSLNSRSISWLSVPLRGSKLRVASRREVETNGIGTFILVNHLSIRTVVR
ncbi:hypothetical protein [Nostoc sp. UHCC 0251]|uniref:hypothetical protein n=1 Tax=Nostoc sp. UHCC 0251 TaxID=3110240 RepID=UPI002B1F6E31|nr:hypothetical protein [Nostoc sp. UHCC 0251]MEA5622258.1 hypothetical protein [Nostoc sp. UHCC 0251]